MRQHILRLWVLVLTAGPAAAVHSENCDKPGAEENLRTAHEFLSENRQREGVVTTESGLQYEVLKQGEGSQTPRSRGTVAAHYELFNADGEKLESTRDRGAPLQFALHEVIPAWQEVVVDMTTGEKRKLYVPPELGYACTGSAPNIGPNELLVFEMELLHIIR